MDAGPIDVLDPLAFDLEPEAAATPQEIIDLQNELEVLLGATTEELLDVEAELEIDHRAELEAAHLVATEGIFTDRDCGDEGDLAEAGMAALEVDELQIDAYGSLPPEAWLPPWEPYQPPLETGGLVEDRGPADPLTPGLPLTPAPPAPPSFEVGAELRNLTGANDRLFAVGDQWKIMVSGPPGCPVSCQAWVDTEPLAPVVVGYTDQMGWFTLQGEMGLEHLGYWVQQWAVGGVAAPSVISFMVK